MAREHRIATGPGSRVTQAMLDGRYEALDGGALKVTAGEREIIAAVRRIPGDEAQRIRAGRAIVEFIHNFAEGLRLGSR